jgi:hypothetical protein
MNQKAKYGRRLALGALLVAALICVLWIVVGQLVTHADNPAPRTIVVPANGDFQSALNEANCDDTIILQAGATYKPQGDSFILTKPCVSLNIRTSGTLPDGRLNPALGGSAKLMSVTGYPVIVATASAKGYRLIGLEITTDGSKYTPDLVSLGSYFTRAQRMDTGHFVFDRCFVHPAEISATNLLPSTLERSSGRGIAIGVTDVSVINSYIAGFAGQYKRGSGNDGQNIDSYGVYADAGPGPIKIVNNYIEAQFNNVFIGGAGMTSRNTATVSDATLTSATLSNVSNLAVGDLIAFSYTACARKWEVGKVSSIAGNKITFAIVSAQFSCAPGIPDNGGTAQWNGDHIRDVEIRGNTLAKPDVWNAFSNPKAWIEIKECTGLVIDGNDMYSGVGTNIAITVRNQDGGSPWSTIQNVTITNNRIRGYKGGFGLLLTDNEQPTVDSGNIFITNNLFTDPKPAPNTAANFLQLVGGFNVVVNHNTILQPGSPVVSDIVTTGFKFTNNVVASYQYNMQCTLAAGGCWPGSVIAGNVVIDTRWNKGDGPLAQFFPPGNYFANTLAEVGLNPDLSLSTSSQFKGKGADGKDPGVDMVALLAALGGASLPTPTPTATPTPLPTATPTPIPSPSPVPTPSPVPSPEGYSYVSKTWPSTATARTKLLNDMGAQGYRLAQVISTTAYFERKQ